MIRVVRQGIFWLVIAGSVCLLLVLAAHTPIARRVVLGLLLSRLQTYGISATAERLDYNLFTLDVTVHGLALAAPGHESAPFLSSAQTRVDLPWSAVAGDIGMDSLELERPVFRFVRREDGAWNLPSGATGSGEAGLPRLDIRRLLVSDGTFSFLDTSGQTMAEAHGIGIDMRPSGGSAEGPIVLNRPATIRWSGASHTLQKVSGRLRFDGASLALSDVAFDTSAGRIVLNGTMAELLSDPVLDVGYRVTTDGGQLAPWIGQESGLAGALDVSGRISGTMPDARVSFVLESPGLSASGVRDLVLTASGDVTTEAVRLSRVEGRLGAGTISGNGTIALGDDAGSRHTVHLAWNDIDSGPLIAALGSELTGINSSHTGTLDAEWAPRNPSLLEASLENTSRADRGSGAPGLEGRLSLSIREHRWTSTIDHRLGDGVELKGTAGGQIDPSDIGRSSLEGRLQLRAEHIRDAVAFLESAGITTLDARGVIATVDLAGHLDSPTYRAELVGSEIRVSDFGPASVTLSASGTTDRASLQRLHVESGGNSLDANGSVGLDARTVALDYTAEIGDPSSLVAQLGVSETLGGHLTAAGTVAGTWSLPRVTANVDGNELTVRGQSADRLSATIRASPGSVTVDSLRLTQPGGQLELSGAYSAADRTFTIDATGTNLQLRPLSAGDGEPPLDVTGRLNLEFQGSGRVDRPSGGGRVTIDELAYEGHQIGRVETTIAMADGRIDLDSTVADLGGQARVSFGPGSWNRYTARGTLERAPLDRLLAPWAPQVPGKLSGFASASFTIDGNLNQPDAATADVQLHALDAQLDGQPIRLTQPATVSLSTHTVRVSNLAVDFNGSSMVIDGALDGSNAALKGSLEGNLADLVPLARTLANRPASEDDIDVEGRIQFAFAASGALPYPELNGTLNIEAAATTVGGMPSVTNLTIRAGIREDLVDLQTLSGEWQGATFNATGEVPVQVLRSVLPDAYVARLPTRASPASLKINFQGVTPSVLSPFATAETLAQLGGEVAGSIDLSATDLSLDTLRADAQLTQADIVIGGVALSQRTPTRITFGDGRARIVALNWGGPTTELRVDGDALVDPAGIILNLSAIADIDLRLAAIALPDTRTGGRARARISVKGNATSPLIAGDVALENAELRMADPPLVIDSVSGLLKLEGDRLSIERLAGLANGGTIEVTGSIVHGNLRPTDGAIVITARGLATAVPEGLRAQLDADLQMRFGGEQPVLAGTVTVLRGAYREALSLTSGLLGTLRETTSTSSAADEPSSAFDSLQMNVRIVTLEAINVDNNYGLLQAIADLRLAGTLGQPGLTGRIDILEGGQVYVGGVVYRIERGTIDFSDAAAIEPELTLTARTRVEAYDITLTLQGTPETLEANLSSDPPASQTDLVSLLVTGRTVAERGGAETDIAREHVLSYLSGELLARSFGLDTIRVERGAGDARLDPSLVATETDPGARLTVGKDLTRDLHVIFSQSLDRNDDFTWIVGYNVRRALEVRFVSNDDEDRSYELRHDLSFGRPPSVVVTSVDRPVVAGRIDAVRFIGVTRFSERELSDRIRQSPGDRFDFYTWQDDRDRLERFYHERGFLEARIRTAQVKSTSGGITLEYDILAGPACAIRSSGFEIDSRLRRLIEQAWSRAIFDDFLADEVVRLLRTELSRSGFLSATVSAHIEGSDGDRKDLVIAVEPGARVDLRQIVFEGNEQVSSDQLAREVDARNLRESAWIDPIPLARAIERFYRNEGFLDASIDVGPPTVDGAEATLRVKIHEGRLFGIESVVVSGVNSLAESEALDALAVEAGEPYRIAQLEEARRRLDSIYRRQGFNDVRVTTRRPELVRDTASVRVAFDVNEGPRQVLRDIQVSGAYDTSPGLVARALNLSVDEPVDLTAWNRARRRLYDTNVFRRADIEVEPIEPSGAAADQDVAAIEPVRAKVTLEEWPRYRLRYGLQLLDIEQPATDTRAIKAGFAADLTRRNLFGRGMTAGATFRSSPGFRVERGFIGAPTLFGRPLASYFFASRTHERFGQETILPFVTDTTEVTAEQRFRVGRLLQISYSYNFERNHTFQAEFDPDDPFVIDFTVDIARLNTTALVDNRDDLANPTRGWFHSSSFEYAANRLGSDIRFSKYLLQQQYYRPIGTHLVLAGAARMGLAAAYDQELIPSERFFAGGGHSVRGYEHDSLGPRSIFGDAAGGNALLVLNGELRFPVYRWVRGVGFIDAGNVFPGIGDLSVTDLKTGAGLGLRLHTPVVLLRVDFGMPLDRVSGDPAGRWYFSLGHAF